MNKNELRIYSSKLSWLMPTLHGTASTDDPRMKEVRDSILLRDNYTCYYCGFRSPEYQEIHHFNHDHEDFSEKNLTTTCPLCHQVFHLSTCSQSTGGSIISLSDNVMTQVELNNLCRMLFVALASGDKDYEINARQIYNTLKSTQSMVDEQISANGSEPMIFAQALQELDEETLNSDYMKNFKLLPKYNRFENIVEYWRDNVFQDLPVSEWSSLIPSTLNINDIVQKTMK